MSEQEISDLSNAVALHLRTHFESPKASLRILNLSKNCIYHKKKALKALKNVVNENFEFQLQALELVLEKYEKDFLNAKERPDPDLLNSYISESYKILKLIIQDTTKLTNYVLPINLNSYFLDMRVPYLEKVVKTLIFKNLRKNKKILGDLITDTILKNKDIYKNYIETELSEKIKFLLQILKSFNLQNKALRYSKEKFIKKYLEDLQPHLTDFALVSNYFRASQQSIYPSKLKNKIEKTILDRLYRDFDISILAQRLPEDLESIYYIFCKDSLKPKLLAAFSKLLTCDIKLCNFDSFISTYKTAKEILLRSSDIDFSNCFQNHFQLLSEDSKNCREIAFFVDETMKNKGNVDKLKIITEIIELSKTPELLLDELQQGLAFRLLDHFKYSQSNITDQIAKELQFLYFFKKPFHSENMYSMINDYENHKNNLLLMTMCKWPVFSTIDIELSPDNPISIFKTQISENLKNDKKKISWIDSLSVVKISISDKEIKVSLFQYYILNKLISEGQPIETCQSLENFDLTVSIPSYSAVYVKNLNNFVPSLYNDQFNVLLEDIIIQYGEFFIFNPIFKKENYLNFNYKFISSNTPEDIDCSYNLDAYNQARVSKILKKLKKTTINLISENIKDLDMDALRIVIRELENKGICDIKDDYILYCP